MDWLKKQKGGINPPFVQVVVTDRVRPRQIVSHQTNATRRSQPYPSAATVLAIPSRATPFQCDTPSRPRPCRTNPMRLSQSTHAQPDPCDAPSRSSSFLCDFPSTCQAKPMRRFRPFPAAPPLCDKPNPANPATNLIFCQSKGQCSDGN